MDGREAMALSGSPPFYMHRVAPGSGSGSGTQTSFLHHTPPGFRPLSNPSSSQVQSNIRVGNAGPTAFAADPSPPPQPPQQPPPPPPSFSHGFSMAVVPSGTPPSGESLKRKRGRPRKYGPGSDGSMSLGLSPVSLTPGSGALTSAQKRGRGRPPGSGRRQQLASLGEWMSGSAGLAFTPHVISITAGEDIATKIMSFSQQRPRAVCILSASGSVSAVTLRQPSASGGSVTYEGRFEILCLSGSYLLAEEGGPRNRTGGLNVSLSSPDGHVVGGSVGGMLVAASPVQVILCSFVYGGGSKAKPKTAVASRSEENSGGQSGDKSATKSIVPPASAAQNLTPTSSMGGGSIWGGSRPMDSRNPHTDIDLTRG